MSCCSLDIRCMLLLSYAVDFASLVVFLSNGLKVMLCEHHHHHHHQYKSNYSVNKRESYVLRACNPLLKFTGHLIAYAYGIRFILSLPGIS